MTTNAGDPQADRQLWLQPVGTFDEPIAEDWITSQHDGLVTHVWTTKHPNQWRAGDLVVYHAAGHRRVVAIVELVGEAEGGHGGRWQWRTPVRPLLLLNPSTGPLLADTGLKGTPDYQRLEPREFNRICDLVREALVELAPSGTPT